MTRLFMTSTRALLTSALLLVALGAFSALAWMTFMAVLGASAARGEVEAIASQSDALRKLAIAGALTRDERTRLVALAVPAGGSAAFIGSVESLGAAARVNASVAGVSAAPPAGAQPGKLDLSVRFSGSYAACMRLISLLETMPLALSITDLSLQYDQAGWSGTLSLSVLSFDEP